MAKELKMDFEVSDAVEIPTKKILIVFMKELFKTDLKG